LVDRSAGASFTGKANEAPRNADRSGGLIGGSRSTHSSRPQSFVWSRQQREALARIDAWLKSGTTPFFYLAGYAGTGKSTLASEIARRQGGNVKFGAFTGKAAEVMRRKGCDGACTIDRLIYRPAIATSCDADPPCDYPHCVKRCRYRRERHVGRELNEVSEVTDADLVIIDEVSMVGEQMGEDLLSFGVPILVLGDEAQLPPIRDLGYFTNGQPDFQLTEVHRQAFGSPIITLATRVREGKALRRGRYGDSAVIGRVDVEEMLEHSQIICGRHVTRHEINRMVREALGYGGPTPEQGEKVICLKNDHRKGLRNGTIWTVVEATPTDDGFVEMEIENEEGERVEVLAPEEGFSSHNGNGQDLPGNPFAFGYCITAHKSQGSQWPSVLVLDESYVFREHSQRWLYTSLTRAVDRVTVST
jgi:exodeoxyribonuclease-5